MLDIYKRKLFLKHYLKRFLLRAIKRSTTSTNSKRYLAHGKQKVWEEIPILY